LPLWDGGRIWDGARMRQTSQESEMISERTIGRIGL
jgi:hypothetical protein